MMVESKRDGLGNDLLVDGDGEDDRLLCHGGGHGFSGGVDDKVLVVRGRGKYKLLKKI